jgi:formylglycine-generating enzyme
VTAKQAAHLAFLSYRHYAVNRSAAGLPLCLRCRDPSPLQCTGYDYLVKHLAAFTSGGVLGLVMRNVPSLIFAIAAILACPTYGGASARQATLGPAPGTLFQDCSVCPTMVMIPAGVFNMGSTNEEADRETAPNPAEKFRERPLHEVIIEKPFALAKYDVTRAEFSEFVHRTGYKGYAQGAPCNVKASPEAHKWATPTHIDWRHPGIKQTGDDPVVCVGYGDAKAYTAWLAKTTNKHYRLPTEAEWEYAARAGTSSARYWGDTRDGACRYANVFDESVAKHLYAGVPLKPDASFHCNDGYPGTSPAGAFPPNPFGVSDMLGNVWQWTEDCFHDNYVDAPTNGSAWLSGECKYYVMRGGSWDFDPYYVRAATRAGGVIDRRGNDLGFRVARTLP